SSFNGDWKFDADMPFYKGSKFEKKDGNALFTEVKTDPKVVVTLDGDQYPIEPQKTGQEPEALLEPRGSGGMGLALYQYHHFLTQGPKGFERGFYHGGYEPFYPLLEGTSRPDSLAKLAVDAEVILTEHAAVKTKWYFSRKDGRLLGFESSLRREDDPCEGYLDDYRKVDDQGRMLPHRIEVRHGDSNFATLMIKKWDLGKKK